MQEPTEKFSVFEPDPNIGNQLAEVVKKLTSVRIRAEEQQDMMVAINLSQGESATAEEILEFFAGY
jgi:phosphoketolase